MKYFLIYNGPSVRREFYRPITKDIYVRWENLNYVLTFQEKLAILEAACAKLLDAGNLMLNEVIVVHEHTFEDKFQITEEGIRSYVWEREYLTVFFDHRFRGDFILYVGLKRVDFTMVLSKDVINDIWSTSWDTVKVPLSLIVRPSFALVARRARLIFDNVDFGSQAGLESFVREVVRLRGVFSGINLSKGYVVDVNILGENYPVINEVVAELVDLKKWHIMDVRSKVKVYKAACNLVCCRIFSKLLVAEKEVAELSIVGLEESQLQWILDMQSLLRVLKSWSYSLLENNVKQHFLRKKALIVGEVYAGFDTEYVAEDWGFNSLVSAQISKCESVKVRVPLRSPFEFEGVNTATGDTYILSVPKFKLEGYYESTIELIIEEARDILFPGHDAGMKNICNYLLGHKDLLGITHAVLDEKGYVFKLETSAIKNTLILPVAGEELKLRFETLVDIINKDSGLFESLEYLGKLFSKAATRQQEDMIGYELSPAWSNDDWISLPTETLYLSNSENSGRKDRIVQKSSTSTFFSLKVRNYLCAHYNAADLGMLEDWAEVSDRNIDILKKSYTSLNAPIMSLGMEVHIRDTILLSSAAASSLAAIGPAYGLGKVKIDPKWYSQMDRFLKKEPKLFEAYAMQDSLITLVHSLFMNNFVLALGELKLPCTLGSMATKYLNRKWKADQYRGYQVDQEFLVGSTDSHTPLGINNLGLLGESINQFIGSYRGGRNECFKYGIDKEKRWYDYDLNACYSTIMSLCGDPDYERSTEMEVEAGTVAANSSLLQAFLLDNEISSKESNALSVLAAEKNSQEFLSILEDKRKEILENIENLPASTYINVKSFAELKTLGDSALDDSYELDIEQLREIQEIEQRTEAEQLAALTPTVASILKEPDYTKATTISPTDDYISITQKYNFMKGYAALRVHFYFPASVKFPPIPVSLKMKSSNQTIYPQSGESLITGPEFLSAANILKSCRVGVLKVLSGTYIPFKEDIKDERTNEIITPAYSPFAPVIQELQANRAKWKKLTGKKSAMERIYKDLGNMLYGKVVSGLSNKVSFDSRLVTMKKLQSGQLTNPIIGCWITGFVRALLAELLHIVQILKGDVCSVTTDGFVCDIPDLENKVLEYMKENNIKKSLLHIFLRARRDLSGDPKAEALEVKTNVRGLLQWTTRGQLSYNHMDPELNNYQVPIAAMTGFQRSGFPQEKLVSLVENAYKENNEILFMQKRLTGAIENYKDGQHVTMLSSFRKFRTIFDSRRKIIESENPMLDTAPYFNIDAAYLARSLLDQFRQSIYSANYSRLFVKNITAKNCLDDMLKYLLRLYSAKFNWAIPLDLKFAIVHRLLKLLKDFTPAFAAEELLDAINTIEQTKGLIVNQIPVYRTTQDFLDTIFSEDYALVKELDLRNKLSNFVLPTIPINELEILVDEAQLAIDSFSLEKFEVYWKNLVRKPEIVTASYLKNTTVEVEKGYVITIDGVQYLRIN